MPMRSDQYIAGPTDVTLISKKINIIKGEKKIIHIKLMNLSNKNFILIRNSEALYY